MARIFLIEQQIIVREAIRHFLFPEHEVVISDEWPTSEDILTHEAAIIDTVTLARLGQNQKDVASLLAQAKIWTLWLHPKDEKPPDSEGTQAVVQKPLDPKLLASVLDDLLGAQLVARAGAKDKPIIELTEVVQADDNQPGKETN